MNGRRAMSFVPFIHKQHKRPISPGECMTVSERIDARTVTRLKRTENTMLDVRAYRLARVRTYCRDTIAPRFCSMTRSTSVMRQTRPTCKFGRGAIHPGTSWYSPTAALSAGNSIAAHTSGMGWTSTLSYAVPSVGPSSARALRQSAAHTSGAQKSSTSCYAVHRVSFASQSTGWTRSALPIW